MELGMSIGDVSSAARGSGARFNEGKLAMEYVPARVLAILTAREDLPESARLARRVLDALGAFEEGGAEDDIARIWALLEGEDWQTAWGHAIAQFKFGAGKYAPFNWAKGMAWSVPIACIKRHALAIIDGEHNDPESGVPHLGAIGCNLVMLAHYWRHYPEMDDRPALVVRESESQEINARAVPHFATWPSDNFLTDPENFTTTEAAQNG
jgi:hypothetical protein